MFRRLALGALVVLAGCVLAGCSSSSIAEDAEWNAADVSFVKAMIPHHEQAVEMAKMVGSTASPELVRLAAAITESQSGEIELMSVWLAEWGGEVDAHGGHGGDDHGMMSDEDMGSLAMASGMDFERMWLTMMIAHHEGAIKMATEVLEQGKDPRVAELAQAVIAAQQAEIVQMRAMLG